MKVVHVVLVFYVRMAGVVPGHSSFMLESINACKMQECRNICLAIAFALESASVFAAKEKIAIGLPEELFAASLRCKLGAFA